MFYLSKFLHFFSRRRKQFLSLIVLLLCLFVGYDRYKLQQYILLLEWRLGNVQLQEDMHHYRVAHPLKGG